MMPTQHASDGFRLLPDMVDPDQDHHSRPEDLAMPEPKHAADPNERFWVRVALTMWYLAVLGAAGYGAVTGLINLRQLPLVLAVIVVAALELGALVLVTFGDFRRKFNEKAIAARLMSAAVAGFAISVNWFGHDGFWRAFFAGFSALGYAVVILDGNARRRDRRYKAQGRCPDPDPEFGVWQWLAEPRLTRLARDIYRRTLVTVKDTDGKAIRDADGKVKVRRLDNHEALDRARDEVEARAARKAIYALLHEDMTAVFGSKKAALAAAVANPDKLVAEVAKHVRWEAIAETWGTGVDPVTFAKALARTDAERKRLTAIADRAVEPGPDRAVDRAVPPQDRAVPPPSGPRGERRQTARSDRAASGGAGARSSGSGGARPTGPGGWFNPARERFYQVYAARINELGLEVAGEELAAGLGLHEGRARNARDQYLRPRYADEYVRGLQEPRGVTLPEKVQDAIAARSRRGATGEFPEVPRGQDRAVDRAPDRAVE
jgi:hypothetical protein